MTEREYQRNLQRNIDRIVIVSIGSFRTITILTG